MQDAIKKKIEERAYELFLKRGGVHGYAMEDWAQAEKEVSAGSKPGKKVEVKPVEVKAAALVAKPVAKAPVAPVKNGKKR